VGELETEHKKLEESWTSLMSLEETKMVYQAMGLVGRGYQSRGHWFACRSCGLPYAVLSTHFSYDFVGGQNRNCIANPGYEQSGNHVQE